MKGDNENWIQTSCTLLTVCAPLKIPKLTNINSKTLTVRTYMKNQHRQVHLSLSFSTNRKFRYHVSHHKQMRQKSKKFEKNR